MKLFHKKNDQASIEDKAMPVKKGNEASKENLEKTNSSILFFGVLISGLFVLFMGYIFFFMFTQKESVVTNQYNTGRQAILESRIIRGSIEAANGERLAYTAVDEEGNELRVYPYRNVFAHVIGYSTNGKMGVESSENYSLVQSHETLSDKIQNDLNNKKDRGDTVVTSLDVDLQRAAYTALGVYQGAIIVTDVKTGQVLCMVSKPDFDPNEIAEIWDDVIHNDESTLLLNRATSGQYAPGSTFKIFTSIEYLKEHSEDWNQYKFNCKGTFKNEEGDTIHCYGHSAHGSLDFASSFARSCNSSFANIGMQLDRDAFGETLTDLLFNQTIPGQFQCAKSKISMGSHVDDYNMLQNSIGQGAVTITPIHLNMITAAIANGGTLYEPYVVTGVRGTDGSTVKTYNPVSMGRILPEDICANMRDFMRDVCTYGTAKSLSKASFTVAGKTGSAEFGTTEDAAHHGMLDSNAWFTGFAPAEDPEIAITVIVEQMGSGGDYAVPIARRVLETYFENKGSEN